jgi:hypothetical protein
LTYRAKGEKPKEEPSPQQNNITNAYSLLSTWKIVPGTQIGGEFDPGAFTKWLSQTEKIVSASGHYDVAMIQLGNLTPHITGSKNQSEERATLFTVRVHVIIIRLFNMEHHFLN